METIYNEIKKGWYEGSLYLIMLVAMQSSDSLGFFVAPIGIHILRNWSGPERFTVFRRWVILRYSVISGSYIPRKLHLDAVTCSYPRGNSPQKSQASSSASPWRLITSGSRELFSLCKRKWREKNHVARSEVGLWKFSYLANASQIHTATRKQNS